MLHLPLSPHEFSAILRSHGWYLLSPMMTEFAPPRLVVPFDLPAGRGAFRIDVEHDVRLTAEAGDPDLCRIVAEECLSLDLDLAPLRQAAAGLEWAWLATHRMGRFLRSPSLFEDCVKILFTVNTTFRRTAAMTEALVQAFGGMAGPYRTFPSPDALLDAGDTRLRDATRCGYRAPFLAALARHAREQHAFFLGDAWRGMSPKDFADTLAAVPGMGPVSVSYIARMYGKPAGFAVDAYVRRRCRELWGVEAQVEQYLADRYGAFGPLGPTVLWFELTRHWHDEPTADPLPAKSA